MIIFLILGIIFCCTSAAFFTAAEASMLAANRVRLHMRAVRGEVNAGLTVALLSAPEKLLTTLLLANNASVILATVLATLTAKRLFGELGGVTAASLLMTAVIAVASELIPKAVAVETPERFAVAWAKPCYVLVKIMTPAYWFVNVMSGGFLGIVKERRKGIPFATREELRAILTGVRGRSAAEVFQRRIIKKIFRFGETPVRKVITPVARVVAVSAQGTVADVADAVVRSGFSKFPVYDERTGEYVGVVTARTMLAAAMDTPVNVFLNAPYFIPATESIEDALAALNKLAVDLAFVREGDKVIGIVTQEDIVEEIIGEIEDEYGWGFGGFVRRYGGYVADGRLPVAVFNKQMPQPLPSGPYITLSGFLVNAFGRVPNPGEEIVFPPYVFKVLRATGKSVRLLGVRMTDEKPFGAREKSCD